MYKNMTNDDLKLLIKQIDNTYSYNINMKDFINTIILYELSEFEIFFKGGTSIFKQYNNLYGRFSEDIDLYINKDYYKKNKKDIKSIIENLENLDYVTKVELNNEQSSENIRVYNVFYGSQYDHSNEDIDNGICKIEICLHGGEPAKHDEVKIISMLEQYHDADFRPDILIKCDNILEIFVDKLFIIQESETTDELSKREYRDIYDIIYIINNFDVTKDSLLQPIKNREQRATHHSKKEYEFKVEKIVRHINNTLESYKNVRNTSKIFHEKLSEEEMNGIIKLMELLKEML